MSRTPKDALETAQGAAARTGPHPNRSSPRQAKKRRLFNETDLLAAAYIALGKIPEPLRSHGTPKQIKAYIQGDHNIPFALGGETTPQNCNLLAKDVHAAKTAKDRKAIAKSKRLTEGAKEFLRKIFAKDHGLQNPAPQKTRKGNRPLPCGRLSGWKKPLGNRNAVQRERPC
jgi:hypothetical protein